MSLPKHNILIVDDEADMRQTLQSILKKKYQPICAASGAEALKILEKETISLMLLDIRMPKLSGIEVLRKVKELDKSLEVIMVTASQDIADAVEAMKLGALDYITKPFEVPELLAVIEKALEKRELVRENLYLKQVLAEASAYGDLIGATPPMKKIFETIDAVAPTDSTVLIQGESGTGKELVGRAIHQRSKRKDKPYVVVNCAAIPETLLESELFGYERGAFTGALERKLGKFELASGGTLFLDEIGCMPTSMQAKLLRILEDKTIYRVGGEAGIPIDIRIISATNIDFNKAIGNGTFREDLYFRLNVIPINLIPLRERKEDIPLFIEYFLNKYNKELGKKIQRFTEEALKIMVNYRWPGNVRELQNLIERVVVLSKSSYIGIEELPISTTKALSVKSLAEASTDFEKEYIQRALRQVEGNHTQAAKLLGMHRTTLRSRLEALGLN